MYSAYWNTGNYATDFISNALDGTDVFISRATTVVSDVSRAVSVERGICHQAILMEIIHHLEVAVTQCSTHPSSRRGLQAAETGANYHWDEAVAYYVGSIPGASGDNIGVMHFALAENMCVEFDTCSIDSDPTTPYKSSVNKQHRDYAALPTRQGFRHLQLVLAAAGH